MLQDLRGNLIWARKHHRTDVGNGTGAKRENLPKLFRYSGGTAAD
jgi:hypothetical protein